LSSFFEKREDKTRFQGFPGWFNDTGALVLLARAKKRKPLAPFFGNVNPGVPLFKKKTRF
jgi:hypothetical protein